MSDWGDFLTIENFELAWQRILRSSHYESKDRVALRVFAANLDANLVHIVNQLREGLFEPSPAEKLYLPKRSGTLRTISVLTVPDQVVYQAIGNIVAARTVDAFEAAVDKVVFAHLANTDDSPFMQRPWLNQYKGFVKRFKNLWKQGHRWLLEADLASYYDSIDHDLLRGELAARWHLEEEVLELLLRCLRCWSSHDYSPGPARGLPQGHHTSDYLSTLFLYPADGEMIAEGYAYIRYVDDIRVLGPSRDKVDRALIELDIALKKQALILQPNKTGARQISDIKEELNRLASLLAYIELKRRQGHSMYSFLISLFFAAWNKRQEDEFAESNLMFALNRLRADEAVRDIALKLMHEMPWRSNFITGYLSQFEGDDVVITALMREITQHKVYAWHISYCIRALSKIAEPEEFRSAFQSIIRDDRLPWYERVAAVEGLQMDHQSYNYFLHNFPKENHYRVRNSMLIAATTAAQTSRNRAEAIRRGLRDDHDHVRATAVWLYLEFPESDIAETEFGPEIGVHRRMIPRFADEQVSSLSYLDSKMASIFEVATPDAFSFKDFLPQSHEEAAKHLRRALTYYETDPVTFVMAIDNLNHILVMAFCKEIAGLKTINEDDYANMLNALVSRGHGAMATLFQEGHKLRSSSVGAHPWAKSLQTWSQNISHEEKEKLAASMKVAYQYFVDQFVSHLESRTT